MWKSFALSLLTLSATTSFADSRFPPIKFKPLCNGHAGGCLPGEYDDPLYPGATGNGMDPREKVARGDTPVREVVESPGVMEKLGKWFTEIINDSVQSSRRKIDDLEDVGVDIEKPKVDVGRDGFKFDGGSVKLKLKFFPRRPTPSPTPGEQPGFNLFDSNGMIYYNIPLDAPIYDVYYVTAKLLNTDTWFRPFRNTDGTVYMIHNYGQYCHVTNYDLTREVLKIPTVIQVRDANMSLYQFTGDCEYPNRTGYNYGHGLWVKLNAYEYCETGWDWFETTGWPWHTVTDESFRTRGFGEKLRNIGPCQR